MIVNIISGFQKLGLAYILVLTQTGLSAVKGGPGGPIENERERLRFRSVSDLLWTNVDVNFFLLLCRNLCLYELYEPVTFS